MRSSECISIHGAPAQPLAPKPTSRKYAHAGTSASETVHSSQSMRRRARCMPRVSAPVAQTQASGSRGRLARRRWRSPASGDTGGPPRCNSVEGHPNARGLALPLPLAPRRASSRHVPVFLSTACPSPPLLPIASRQRPSRASARWSCARGSWWRASSPGCTGARTTASRSSSRSTAPTTWATSCATSTGRCGRGRTAGSSSSTRRRPTCATPSCWTRARRCATPGPLA